MAIATADDISKLVTQLSDAKMQLQKYRRLYNLFGKDGMTDAKFVHEYEAILIADK